MQLRNNQSRNVQLYFWKDNKETKQKQLEYVHIPGGATVEIEDDIFKQLTESKSESRELREEILNVEGAEVMHLDSKLKVGIKEYFETGKVKTVNILSEEIKAGLFTVVSRAKVSGEQINQLLIDNGVNIKDMPDEKKLELYDKLA
ncbi:hypothetical protein PP101_59 [Pectobacterium phage PP101]|uniref:Uncharacterized protein n=1 Tax=Pectobacterium phage PP101 TaxID=1916414 RepID=A0A1J0MEZ1_9CAUD|nr:hypothetical protein HOR42_gp59 [Pectobacterium phage PP101]APD19716.1 hypothetical protein PP101_59 [Pectobacterium phage PP101]